MNDDMITVTIPKPISFGESRGSIVFNYGSPRLARLVGKEITAAVNRRTRDLSHCFHWLGAEADAE